MISLFLILSLIVIISLIVEIAAIALKLTGLDIHTARFQALSAITGTGFTTKETERIMNHRQRRGIVMTLMIIGPICFLGMFSSLLISMKEEFALSRLLILLGFVAVLLVLTRSPRFIVFFHKQVERQLKRYRYPRKIQLEEVLQLSGDHGVYELKIDKNSRFAHKVLRETDFREKGFIVLAIERDKQLLTVPGGHDTILPEDVLVIFGQFKGLKALVNG
jgi:hypothetical protein